MHRGHCKYFSGSKDLKDTVVHDKETCNYCMMQESVRAEMFKEENPNYFCLFDQSMLGKNVGNADYLAETLVQIQLCYPMPLTEVRRDRSKRLVDLLQRLLLKIRLTATGQPISLMYPGEVRSLTHQLLLLQLKMFYAPAFKPPEWRYPYEIIDFMGQITDDMRNVPLWGRFHMWQTLLMVADLLYWITTIEGQEIIKKPKKSLPKAQRQMSKAVKESSFLQLTDQVLEALEEKVVSHSDLARIVCDGNLQRTCTACDKAITIGGFYYRGMRHTNVPVVVFSPDKDIVFSCGGAGCEDQLTDRSSVHPWTVTVSATVAELNPTRCDNCFLLAPIKEVHRLDNHSSQKWDFYCIKDEIQILTDTKQLYTKTALNTLNLPQTRFLLSGQYA